MFACETVTLHNSMNNNVVTLVNDSADRVVPVPQEPQLATQQIKGNIYQNVIINPTELLPVLPMQQNSSDDQQPQRNGSVGEVNFSGKQPLHLSTNLNEDRKRMFILLGSVLILVSLLQQ